MDLKQIGVRIGTLRQQYTNLSQSEFSKSIGMDRTYLSRVESGKQNITVENLIKICEGIGVSLKVFFDFEEDDK